MKDADQLSFGSVISLRSVSDAGGLESERPRGKRPSSASKKNKKGSPYGTPTKSLSKKSTLKTGREVWVAAIQNGGGMSAESAGMNTWKDGKPSNLANRSNGSNFLMEQLLPNSKKQTRPSSATARVGGSGPVYKDAESYYDEIQVLKRNLKQSKGENDILKAKNNRLEDEVLAKSKKIDELLNPETQSNDLRRTLTSKRPGTSEVVMSLRRKIHKLEETLRGKENELRKISSDLKVTNLDELNLENQMYQYEIQRLTQMLQESQFHAGNNTISDDIINDALRDNKGRKSQILIKRLTEDNHSLVLENKSLKNDLMKLTEGSTTENLNKDYEDMNRTELLQKIQSLEQRLKEEESSTLKETDVQKDVEVDEEAIDDRCIELKGPPPQQVKQLRAREKELLGDIERLENSIKKLKEDRSHYRKMTDDYRQQLESLSKENQDGCSDTASVKSENTVKRKKSGSVTPRKLSENTKKSDEEKDEEKITQKKNDVIATSSRKEKQKSDRVYMDEEDELENAIISVQSAWRGHHSRSDFLKTNEERKEEVDDDDILLIQSAFRGHAARKNVLIRQDNRRGSRKSSKYMQDEQRAPYYEEDDETDEDDAVVIGSSASLSKYRDSPRKSRKPKIYEDPDAPSYNAQNRHNTRDKYDPREKYDTQDKRDLRGNKGRDRNDRNKERNRGSVAAFLDEDESEDNERAREELSRRFRLDEEEEMNTKKTSISTLKSSSSPWKNTYQIDDSDEQEDTFPTSKSSSKRKDSRKESRTNRNERLRDDITDKWAKSGSTSGKKNDKFERNPPFRKSTQLLRDFSRDEENEDDTVIAPSFQKRLASMKKQNLNDELF